MSKVRMADIAEKLGISTVSVSKGLAGKDGVSEGMRKKIVQTALEMGYQFRKAEETLPPEGCTIGVIVADRFFNEEAFYYRLYTELLKKCQEAGLSLLMEIITPQKEDACLLPTLLLGQKVQGLILMGEFHDSYCRLLREQAIPMVLLDFYKDDWDTDCILSDNLQGSRMLTEHLLAEGYRDIAFVGSITATSSIMDRYLGYCKALLRAGITPEKSRLLEDRDEKGAFISLSLPEQLPQAFVCNCDVVACQLVKRLESAGYRVPQDVAVTGYDDFRYADVCTPPLTSYHIPVQGMAEAAVRRIQSEIQGQRAEPFSWVIKGMMILRASTQACSKKGDAD